MTQESLPPNSSRTPSSVEDKTESHTLKVSLSESLFRKLQYKAQGEGVSLEELARELLAEGVVLRAWEIVERNKAMMRPNSNAAGFSNENRSRSPNSRPQSPMQKPRSGFQNPNSSAPNHAQRRPSNYRNILEDSANFIEYVRSQERKK